MGCGFRFGTWAADFFCCCWGWWKRIRCWWVQKLCLGWWIFPKLKKQKQKQKLIVWAKKSCHWDLKISLIIEILPETKIIDITTFKKYVRNHHYFIEHIFNPKLVTNPHSALVVLILNPLHNDAFNLRQLCLGRSCTWWFTRVSILKVTETSAEPKYSSPELGMKKGDVSDNFHCAINPVVFEA